MHHRFSFSIVVSISAVTQKTRAQFPVAELKSTSREHTPGQDRTGDLQREADVVATRPQVLGLPSFLAESVSNHGIWCALLGEHQALTWAGFVLIATAPARTTTTCTRIG